MTYIIPHSEATLRAHRIVSPLMSLEILPFLSITQLQNYSLTNFWATAIQHSSQPEQNSCFGQHNGHALPFQGCFWSPRGVQQSIPNHLLGEFMVGTGRRPKGLPPF